MKLVGLRHLSSSSATKSTLVKPAIITISLPILETHLKRCQTPFHFNQILSHAILTGFIRDTFAASRVLKFSTESRFLGLELSFRVFSLVQNPNGFIWNTLMRSCVQRKRPREALVLYKVMLKEGFLPDNYTYPVLIQSCALRSAQSDGKQVHCHVFKTGFCSDVYVQNTLINMYSVCGNMVYARKLFDESPCLDAVTWNSILAGYVQMEEVEEAKGIYDRMPVKNTIASNSIIVLFGKTGQMAEARKLFDEMPERDMVSWSALISCFEQNGMYGEALSLFVKMVSNGIQLDEVVVITVLSVCANVLASQTGESVHCLVVKSGIESYINLHNALIHAYSSFGELKPAETLFNSAQSLNQITWNSMLSAYLRSGLVKEAESLFKSMPEKDLVSWSAMISGHAQQNLFSKTLELFNEMLQSRITPDETTLVSVVSACAHLADLDNGKWVHEYIKNHNLKVNPILGTTLIDMYSKCGCIENASKVFRTMKDKSVSSWNALILGLATNGMVSESLEIFSEMKSRGAKPNEVTFVAVLVACRHMGLVDEGRAHFDSMSRDYGIEPNVRHFGCMVDLLGRAGLVEEAERVLESMPVAPDAATWGALLGACKKHGAHEMGERIGKRLVELRPDHDGFHVMLSNIYASRGDWSGAEEVRGTMVDRGVVKVPGRSAMHPHDIDDEDGIRERRLVATIS